MARTIPALTLDGLAAAPWALDRAVLSELVGYAQSGGTLTESIRAAIRPLQATPQRGAVALIPIHGMIEHRSSLLMDVFGGSSVEDIRTSLRAAVASPQVSAIVLDIDSPGGGVAGITELAAEIRNARSQKRIVAVANTFAASAAYWLGAQADHFLITPSGTVGSVGIFALHLDFSKQLESEGVTPTLIAAGEHKGEGNPAFPLSDDAKQAMHARADAFLTQMEGDVARGRGVSAAFVHEKYGQGAVFLAKEALALGMVDGIGTLDDALRLANRPPSAVRAEDGTPDPSEVDLPFRARVEQAAEEMATLVEWATVRANLRTKENELRAKEDRPLRPLLAPQVETALRTSRDAISALLVDEPPAAAATSPDEPVQPVAPVVAAIPAAPRFKSPAEWAAYVKEIAQ